MKLQKIQLVSHKVFWMTFNTVCGNWYSKAGCPNTRFRDIMENFQFTLVLFLYLKSYFFQCSSVIQKLIFLHKNLRDAFVKILHATKLGLQCLHLDSA